MCNHRLVQDDDVEITAGLEKTSKRDLPVIFKDDFCIVIDKPPGLLSDGINSAEEHLKVQFKNNEILAVHRLDRDTSGCLLFAMNAEAKRALVPVFKSQEITKVYQVIVTGQFNHGDKKCSEPIEGKRAVTHFRTLDAGR